MNKAGLIFFILIVLTCSYLMGGFACCFIVGTCISAIVDFSIRLLHEERP